MSVRRRRHPALQHVGTRLLILPGALTDHQDLIFIWIYFIAEHCMVIPGQRHLSSKMCSYSLIFSL